MPEAGSYPTVVPQWLQQLGWVSREWTNKTWGQVVERLLRESLAPSTRHTYCAAQGRYLTFCAEQNTLPVPMNEDILCKFVAWLFVRDLAYQTMKSYLSAMRHFQIMSGLGDPFASEMPRLQYVLKGARVERSKSTPGAKRSRLPITPANHARHLAKNERCPKPKWRGLQQHHAMGSSMHMLFWFPEVWGNNSAIAQRLLLKVPPYHERCVRRQSWEARDNPPQLKASKTDPFRKGVTISL